MTSAMQKTLCMLGIIALLVSGGTFTKVYGDESNDRRGAKGVDYGPVLLDLLQGRTRFAVTRADGERGPAVTLDTGDDGEMRVYVARTALAVGVLGLVLLIGAALGRSSCKAINEQGFPDGLPSLSAQPSPACGKGTNEQPGHSQFVSLIRPVPVIGSYSAASGIMRYWVYGLDAISREPREPLFLDAENEDAARKQAAESGMAVEEVELVQPRTEQPPPAELWSR